MEGKIEVLSPLGIYPFAGRGGERADRFMDPYFDRCKLS